MKQNGFTLIELIVVIAIIGITAAIGLPGMWYVIDSSRLTSKTNELVGAFNLARIEAIKRGTVINVSSLTTDGNWTTGFRVWQDENSDNTYDAGEEIHVFGTAGSGLTLTGPTNSVAFLASGFTRLNSNTELTLCTNNTSLDDRRLRVNTAGRVSVSEVACP